jgi:hypothetical protein
MFGKKAATDDSDPRSYKNLREKWTHEDHLIHHRLSWLLLSQTLLFAAYGAVLKLRIDLGPSCVPDEIGIKVESLVQGIPWFGLITSFLILLSVGAAALAMRQLKKDHPEVKLDVAKYTSRMGLVASLGLPFIFIAAWLDIIFS